MVSQLKKIIEAVIKVEEFTFIKVILAKENFLCEEYECIKPYNIFLKNLCIVYNFTKYFKNFLFHKNKIVSSKERFSVGSK